MTRHARYAVPAKIATTGLILASLWATTPTLAQAPVATPEATSFGLHHDTPDVLAYGFGEHLPGETQRIGLYVACERSDGRLRAQLFFGSYPAGKPVQAAVRTADGAVERFGPIERGGPRTGFHDPRVEDPSDIQRLVNAAFTPDALVSNGHRSVWNRIPAPDNRQARESIATCAR